MPDENSMLTVLPKLMVSPDVKVITPGAALATLIGMNVKALAIINAVKSKATDLLRRFLLILLSPFLFNITYMSYTAS
jgi:hypothetical protein